MNSSIADLLADPAKVAALRAAFAAVQDFSNWKKPVASVIVESDRALVADAIEFFTASEATFEPYTGQGFTSASAPVEGVLLFVTAPGYYAAVGA